MLPTATLLVIIVVSPSHTASYKSAFFQINTILIVGPSKISTIKDNNLDLLIIIYNLIVVLAIFIVKIKILK